MISTSPPMLLLPLHLSPHADWPTVSLITFRGVASCNCSKAKAFEEWRFEITRNPTPMSIDFKYEQGIVCGGGGGGPTPMSIDFKYEQGMCG